MVFKLPKSCGGKTIHIKGVLWVPHANSTLISLGHLDDAGWKYIGTNGKLTLFNKSNDVIGRIPTKDGLYKATHDFAGNIVANSMSLSMYEIHILLGHVSYGHIHEMIRNKQLMGIKVKQDKDQDIPCIACIQGKIVRSPIHKI